MGKILLDKEKYERSYYDSMPDTVRQAVGLRDRGWEASRAGKQGEGSAMLEEALQLQNGTGFSGSILDFRGDKLCGSLDELAFSLASSCKPRYRRELSASLARAAQLKASFGEMSPAASLARASALGLGIGEIFPAGDGDFMDLRRRGLRDQYANVLTGRNSLMIGAEGLSQRLRRRGQEQIQNMARWCMEDAWIGWSTSEDPRVTIFADPNMSEEERVAARANHRAAAIAARANLILPPGRARSPLASFICAR